ncbi:GldG family protein [Radicibacter daui]|uniref:GldG family protein n=1 Tax=Radicibacter daui TaxID=3064829 RepID=UPI0040468B02
MLSTPASRALAAASLAGVLFVSTQLVSDGLFKGARLDLTQRHLYSLAPATKEVLGKLKDPITLRFFYSKSLGEAAPNYGVYANRVKELLEELAGASDGKIKLEIYDPEPFSAEEDRANAYGLQPVPVDQTGTNAYFGLVGTNMTDDEQAIPFFQPQEEGFLHYDLTKLVYQLANPEKPQIAVISGLPIAGGPPNMQGQATPPWQIDKELQAVFDVHELGGDVDSIDPKTTKALLLIHPQGLSEQTQYAIDQYVLKGGKAMVMLDPLSEAEQRMQQQPGGDLSSHLDKLLKAWGVEMEPGKLAADADNAQRVQVMQGGRPAVTDYVLWMGLKAQNFASDDPATADIDTVNLATAGVLNPVKGATTTFKPIGYTSPDSEEVDAAEAMFQPDPAKLLNEFKPGGKPLTIAARVTGEATSAFPDGPPPPKKKEADAAGKAPDAAADAATAANEAKAKADFVKDGKIEVLVFADTDMLRDEFWIQTQNFFGSQDVTPIASNGNLVVSAMEHLSGAPDLSSLRGQGLSARPFTVIDSLTRKAEARYRQTENKLEQDLKDTQSKLTALQKGTSGDDAKKGVLTGDQQKELDSFRGKVLEIRTQLRDVQRKLREDIERLGSWVKFVNIALVPILVAVTAIGLGLLRSNRRRRVRGDRAAKGQ